MGRKFYDGIAASWRTAVDAVHPVADQITVPVVQMNCLLYGYEELRAQREAVVAFIDILKMADALEATALLDLQHRVGLVSDDEWNAHIAEASKFQSLTPDPGEVS